MTPQTSVDGDAPASPWSTVARTIALLTVLTSVLLTVFAWPAARSSIHDVPLVVAGPPALRAHARATLDERLPGGFDIIEVADTATAEHLVRDRTALGAIDLSSGTPQVSIASAAGPAVAQALQGLASHLGQTGPGVPVRDLAALPADDPRGAGLATGTLPLAMGGLLAAVLLIKLVRGRIRRAVGAVASAVTAALAAAAILQFWLGSLSGSYLANTGAIALTIAAIASTALGLESVVGSKGIGITALVMLLIGNAVSGAATAPEMLPRWAGTLGQLLPPGAGSRLLRSTAFFDGRGVTHAVVVLAVWISLGAALYLVGLMRLHPRAHTEPVAVPVPA